MTDYEKRKGFTRQQYAGLFLLAVMDENLDQDARNRLAEWWNRDNRKG